MISSFSAERVPLSKPGSAGGHRRVVLARAANDLRVCER